MNDDISEIDMNSDTQSQVHLRSNSLRKNNLMQGGTSHSIDMYSSKNMSQQLNDYERQESMIDGSLNSSRRDGMPPFHPGENPKRHA